MQAAVTSWGLVLGPVRPGLAPGPTDDQPYRLG